MTGLKGFEKGELEIKEKDSTTFKAMSFPIRRIQLIEFVGEDKRGDNYLKTARYDENKGIVVEVHKFSFDNDYLCTITMPKSYIFFVPNREYFVNKNGTVYRLLPESDKLRLEIFQSEDN